jgi:hypothetical protein
LEKATKDKRQLAHACRAKDNELSQNKEHFRELEVNHLDALHAAKQEVAQLNRTIEAMKEEMITLKEARDNLPLTKADFNKALAQLPQGFMKHNETQSKFIIESIGAKLQQSKTKLPVERVFSTRSVLMPIRVADMTVRISHFTLQS